MVGIINYLYFQISSGYVFGADQPLILHLLDITPMMGVLNGVVMEIQVQNVYLFEYVCRTRNVKETIACYEN